MLRTSSIAQTLMSFLCKKRSAPKSYKRIDDDFAKVGGVGEATRVISERSYAKCWRCAVLCSFNVFWLLIVRNLSNLSR